MSEFLFNLKMIIMLEMGINKLLNHDFGYHKIFISII